TDGGGDGQAVSGVPGGGLDDGATGLEQPGLLRSFDHPKADPILDASARIEHLELGEDGGPDPSGDVPQPDQRGLADGVEERLQDPHGGARFYWPLCDWTRPITIGSEPGGAR